jgi:hypothetical protein
VEHWAHFLILYYPPPRPSHRRALTAAEQVESEKAAPESVFGIALCCVDAEYEGQSDDVLPAAFDAFPSRDFGVVRSRTHCTPEADRLNFSLHIRYRF